MKNWMTTLTGVATILFAVAGLFIGKLTWDQALPMLLAGVGLIAAKDFNVTGGASFQPTPPVVQRQQIIEKAKEEANSPGFCNLADHKSL